MAQKKSTQCTLEFPNTRGGARKGAGRKPKGRRAGVPHRPRAPLASRMLHLIAEGRIAKRLNRRWSRKCSIVADRFHDRILRTPREVRNALRYVLQNARKHGALRKDQKLDPCSSARWFDGWRERLVPSELEAPLARARTWLVNVGWRRHGRIGMSEVPSSG